MPFYDIVFCIHRLTHLLLHFGDLMTIDKDIEAKILRYHFVELWKVGTIATQLGIHH